MAAISFAKSAAAALSREKPRSSITEWVDILTGPGYDDEGYDGIPELIDSIHLQASGPTEASRAIRKKLKHGNPQQQYRALVILKALVENCGTKFQTTFADGQLTDAIRNLAIDSATDAKVKRKTIAVLASWHNQFKDDRSMQTVAGLYRQCRPADTEHRARADREREERDQQYERRRHEEKSAKEEAKRRAKLEKEAEKERERERLRQAAEAKKKRSSQPTTKRKAFNFEQEKPQVLNSIANASSAANNLLNAITLVNTEHDSLQSNERVQECITRAKQSRKQIVRYIQLVEDEEFIGTLIETNERIINALETFDKLSKPNVTERDVEEVQQGMAAAHIGESEVQKLQEKQRAAVQRAARYREQDRAYDDDDDEPPSSAGLHPDLQDLSFGTLGKEKSCLPPPIRPTVYGSDDDQLYKRGSLSDFSDYESSNEDAHAARAGSSKLASVHYTTVSEDDLAAKKASQKKLDEEDPFADPFAD